MKVGSEAQVRETKAQLAADEPFRVIQAIDRRLTSIVLANDAHLHGGIAEVGTELDLADGGHPDPWILQVTDDDLADFLAKLCGDPFDSMSAHALIVWSVCSHLPIDVTCGRRDSLAPGPAPQGMPRL